MGNYKISSGGQSVNVVVEGAFTPSDSQNFISDFKKEVSKIISSQCDLYVDATNLSASSKDMQEMLKGCFNLYKSFNFKKVLFTTGSNAIIKMQLQRLARETNQDNFIVI